MHYRKMPAIFSVLTFAILVFSAVAGEEQKKMAEVEEAIPETAEQGTVVFYRVRSAKGGAIRLNISGGNDGTVGILSNGSKIVKKFPVGEYTFTISSPSIAVIMRAIRISDFSSEYDKTLSLEEVEKPTPSPGFAVVAIKAASGNPVDFKVLQGYLKDTWALPGLRVNRAAADQDR